jgi:hypothetical protein
MSGIVMHFVKHSVFPVDSGTRAQRARRFCSFELTPVMRVFDIKGEMAIGMHVNDDRCKVDNVKIKVFQILQWIP